MTRKYRDYVLIYRVRADRIHSICSRAYFYFATSCEVPL